MTFSLDDPFGADYRDRLGNPISFTRLVQIKTDDYSVVGKTRHGDIEISTVWLGWSLKTDDQGRPLIFETAIFDEDPEVAVYIVARFATEADAIEAHAYVVGFCRINRPLRALLPG